VPGNHLAAWNRSTKGFPWQLAPSAFL